MALVVCFVYFIVLRREGGNFRLWTQFVTVCVTYVQVSFVTLVCSPSISVIIADLAKQSI